MQVTANGKFKLASYQLKDVIHIWYTQWNDPEDTLKFVNLLLPLKFDVNPKTFSEFSVSTPVGDPVIATWVYKK